MEILNGIGNKESKEQPVGNKESKKQPIGNKNKKLDSTWNVTFFNALSFNYYPHSLLKHKIQLDLVFST
jgi:hypothetical protein